MFVAAIRSCVGTALCFLLASVNAESSQLGFGSAVAAIKSGDCEKLGTLVNDGLDTNAAMMLVAGLMHEEGMCVDRDLARASRYYEAAGIHRDWRTELDIGLHYAQGSLFERSYVKAGAWIARSVSHRANAKPIPVPVTSLPVTQTTSELDWAGYLISVTYVAPRLIQYPRNAQSKGIQGSYLAKACLAQQEVSVQLFLAQPGSSASPAPVDAGDEFGRAVERAYQSAMRNMPRPSSPPTSKLCFQQPIAFRLR